MLDLNEYADYIEVKSGANAHHFCTLHFSSFLFIVELMSMAK